MSNEHRSNEHRSNEPMSDENTLNEHGSAGPTSHHLDRWRAAVSALEDDAIDKVVIVQCDLRWLLDWNELRDELDEALLRRLLVDKGFRVTRLIWHDVPPELAGQMSSRAEALFGGHRDWIERLTASLSLVNSRDSLRLRVLRLIERGGDVGHPPDGISAWTAGRWTNLVGAGGADLETLVSAATNVTLLNPGIGDMALPAEDLDITHLL
jgi:hypothetical protein